MHGIYTYDFIVEERSTCAIVSIATNNATLTFVSLSSHYLLLVFIQRGKKSDLLLLLRVGAERAHYSSHCLSSWRWAKATYTTCPARQCSVEGVLPRALAYGISHSVVAYEQCGTAYLRSQSSLCCYTERSVLLSAPVTVPLCRYYLHRRSRGSFPVDQCCVPLACLPLFGSWAEYLLAVS